jgi:formamidopyrimidine-DNA glycosylase
VKCLGQDPLRQDADAEVLWAAVQRSRKPIGLVLMDQSMIAGVGNIYRAEILFKVRLVISPTEHSPS